MPSRIAKTVSGPLHRVCAIFNNRTIEAPFLRRITATMDLLLANFPERFPIPKRLEELRKSSSDHEFPGDAGESLDEVERPEDVVQCDDEYLEGVRQMLEDIDEDFRTAVAWPHGVDLNTIEWLAEKDVHDIETDSEESFARAIAGIAQVKPMIARLKAHPELFSDARTRKEFFRQLPVGTIRGVLRYFKLYRNWKKYVESIEKPRLEAGKSYPIDPVLGRPYSPWQSWCRQLPLQKNSPTIQTMLAKHKGLQPSTTQLFPHQGLLLAERRRQKVEAIVTDILETSPSPELAEAQMPPNKRALVARTISKPGASAVVSQVLAQPQKTEQNSKNFAFGERTPVAARARLLALLDRDCTTRREKLAIFHGTFLSPEEMKAAQREAISLAATLDHIE